MAFQTATKAILLASALLYTQPAEAQDLKEELDCLARNIYFESRNQPLAGRLAVGQVTMNRVDSPKFPNTVCDVVMQGGERLHRCQFSWYCDGEIDYPSDEIRFREASDLAITVYVRGFPDLTEGALWYHANYIKQPDWARSKTITVKINEHIFYK